MFFENNYSRLPIFDQTRDNIVGILNQKDFFAALLKNKEIVISELMNMSDEYCYSVSATTRNPREGEKDGVDYFFISKTEFIKRKDEDSFVETTEYNGNFYGCSKSQIEDTKAVIVDPNGLKSFLKLNQLHLEKILSYIQVEQFVLLSL